MAAVNTLPSTNYSINGASKPEVEAGDGGEEGDCECLDTPRLRGGAASRHRKSLSPQTVTAPGGNQIKATICTATVRPSEHHQGNSCRSERERERERERGRKYI